MLENELAPARFASGKQAEPTNGRFCKPLLVITVQLSVINIKTYQH